MSDCDFQSLLPHPSPVELALEQEASSKYCRANPDLIKQLHDPWSCPAEFLPWLAYALSVDVWNPQWPEATRRAVCANAVTVHLNKGTRGGLDDAMAALGLSAEIVEWWEQEPEGSPGTMQLTIWLQKNLLPHADVLFGAELIADVRAVIDRTKRASIHYIFRLAVEASAVGIGLASSGQMTTHQRTDALHRTTATRATVPTGIGLASSGQMMIHQRTDALHRTTTTRATAPVSLGFASSGQMTTHLRLEASI